MDRKLEDLLAGRVSRMLTGSGESIKSDATHLVARLVAELTEVGRDSAIQLRQEPGDRVARSVLSEELEKIADRDPKLMDDIVKWARDELAAGTSGSTSGSRSEIVGTVFYSGDNLDFGISDGGRLAPDIGGGGGPLGGSEGNSGRAT